MKPKIDSKWLRRRCEVLPFGNLRWLALDYLTLLLILGGAVSFDFWRSAAGLGWGWTAMVWLCAAFAVGAVQHRLALMGHEASHYLLHPNRKWNDVLADVFCFYPVFGTLLQYRARHLRHHLHPNDAEKDPNLAGRKLERFYSGFPMSKRRFYYRYCLGFLWPPFVLTNLFDLIRVVMLGGGAAGREDRRRRRKGSGHLSTLLGLVYVIALVISMRLANGNDFPVLWVIGIAYGVALSVWALLPRSIFFQGASAGVAPAFLALLRLTFYTGLFGSFALVRQHLGYHCGPAFLVLWVFPLVYVFPYLMLVREIFQHANAGQGELDNSRVMHLGPLARWALMGYGNDYHLIHHLYPNVPGYRLREVHDHLLEAAPEYRSASVETSGLHRSGAPDQVPSLLDALADRSGDGKDGLRFPDSGTGMHS